MEKLSRTTIPAKCAILISVIFILKAILMILIENHYNERQQTHRAHKTHLHTLVTVSRICFAMFRYFRFPFANSQIKIKSRFFFLLERKLFFPFTYGALWKKTSSELVESVNNRAIKNSSSQSTRKSLSMLFLRKCCWANIHSRSPPLSRYIDDDDYYEWMCLCRVFLTQMFFSSSFSGFWCVAKNEMWNMWKWHRFSSSVNAYGYGYLNFEWNHINVVNLISVYKSCLF